MPILFAKCTQKSFSLAEYLKLPVTILDNVEEIQLVQASIRVAAHFVVKFKSNCFMTNSQNMNFSSLNVISNNSKIYNKIQTKRQSVREKKRRLVCSCNYQP